MIYMVELIGKPKKKKYKITDKYLQLKEVLDAIFNGSECRWYDLKGRKPKKKGEPRIRSQYDHVIDYILGEPDKLGYRPQAYRGYYGTEYTIKKATSTYDDFRNLLEDEIIFNQIVMDVDNEEDPRKALEDAVRICQGLDEKGITPLLNFSGSKGAHITLVFDPVEVEHPREVKERFSLEIEKKFKVKLDEQVYHSISRMIRVPCSRHQGSKKYGHFLDYKDDRCINEVYDMGLCEISTQELLESDTKYYIPPVPDTKKNYEKIHQILEYIDQTVTEEEESISKPDTIDYGSTTYKHTTDEEFLNNIKTVWIKGHRNSISHRLIHLWRRSNKPKEEVVAFFKELDPEFKEVYHKIEYVYTINPSDPKEHRRLGGLNYFLQGVIDACPEDQVEALTSYFKSVFIHQSPEAVELNQRKDPSDRVNIKKAEDFRKYLINEEEENLKTKGYQGALIEYLNNKLKNLMIGDTGQVIMATLGCFNVMRGDDSYFIISEGEADTGKSYELEVCLYALIPEEYLKKFNDSTLAGITRASKDNPRIFERMIIYAGDFGDKKTITKFTEEVEPVFKQLITEKEYHRIISDNKGKVVELHLEADSVAFAFTTANTGEDLNSQTVSRSLKMTSNDKKNEAVKTFYSKVDYEGHPLSQKKKETEAELKKDFQNYIQYKMTHNKTVCVGHFNSVFQDLTKESETSTRDFKRMLHLFNAYCTLTDYQCETLSNGDLIATETQLKDFISGACPESAMNPKAYNLLNLIRWGKSTPPEKGDTKDRKVKPTYKIEYFKEESTEPTTDGRPSARQVFNDMYEDIIGGNQTILDRLMKKDTTTGETIDQYITVEDLPKTEKEIFITNFLKRHRIKPNVGGAVFTVADITSIFKNYKAYKDIEDISGVLYNLYLEGYIGLLEFKDNYRKNIYYLTTKAENIGEQVRVTEDHRKDYLKWLEDIEDEPNHLDLLDKRERD